MTEIEALEKCLLVWNEMPKAKPPGDSVNELKAHAYKKAGLNLYRIESKN